MIHQSILIVLSKMLLKSQKKNASRITVVTVINDSYAASFAYTSKADPNIIKNHIKTLEKSIMKLSPSAKKEGIPFSLKILQGASIVKTLVNFTKAKKFDLIVMGSHGRTGFSKLVLGSVSNGIVQHVKCPVMIVK